jgi:transcriptional regulator with XRE-family HTH domain
LITMNQKLRDLIKKRMKELGINQEVLADRLSMTPSQVSRIISGARGTTLENLLSIADLLHVDRGYFLNVAAGVNPDPGKDDWIEETSNKIKLVPPSFRGLVNGAIDLAIRGEENNGLAKPRPAKRGVK